MDIIPAKPDWQQRIINEKKELDERIEKLKLFIATNEKFKELQPRKRALLVEQLEVMRTYSDILAARLED